MDLQEFWAPHQGAVSLTFDDGFQSQLDKGIPALEKAGLRATFYPQLTGETWERNREAWRNVAAAGHEIGNHSLSHICSGNFAGRKGLEDTALEEIEADILAAQDRLAAFLPEQREWTFCYPCAQSYVGRGLSRRSYVPLVAKHFLAGRGYGEYGHANHPAAVDLAYVWALDVSLMGGFEMIGFVEELTTRGRWVVLALHEIEGRRLSVTGYDLEMLLGHLQRRSDRIWTAPFLEVARRVARYQSERSR
jgi:peptidoglycan/xylan/chitin deacetylase (PgdA/CDA1 family)